jgi:hypothetical protein
MATTETSVSGPSSFIATFKDTFSKAHRTRNVFETYFPGPFSAAGKATVQTRIYLRLPDPLRSAVTPVRKLNTCREDLIGRLVVVNDMQEGECLGRTLGKQAYRSTDLVQTSF